MTLDISQEELGQLAGVSRQSANRALHHLSEQGLLSIRHGALTVRDLDKLTHYGA